LSPRDRDDRARGDRGEDGDGSEGDPGVRVSAGQLLQLEPAEREKRMVARGNERPEARGEAQRAVEQQQAICAITLSAA
jgi:hypothetical protein